MVNLTTADIADCAGAQAILDTIRKRWPWVKRLFANGAYPPLTKIISWYKPKREKPPPAKAEYEGADTVNQSPDQLRAEVIRLAGANRRHPDGTREPNGDHLAPYVATSREAAPW